MEKYAGVKFRTRIEKGSVGGVSGFLGLDRALAKYLKPEANEGNMSMRAADGFLIKRSGARMTSLTGKDVVLVKNVENNVVHAVGGTPSSESILHHEVYRKRKDAGVILHFHNDSLLEELDWETVGPFPYGSRGLADAVAKAAGKTDRIKIAGHGFVLIAKGR
ncbi:class II aldolase/adducin family protein, partial [Candidatus Micrarchaeota archaeon]|nr:class II aldolase/adducin family protein [Candidatus Micrarchaeota archaeon]